MKSSDDQERNLSKEEGANNNNQHQGCALIVSSSFVVSDQFVTSFSLGLQWHITTRFWSRAEAGVSGFTSFGQQYLPPLISFLECNTEEICQEDETDARDEVDKNDTKPTYVEKEFCKRYNDIDWFLLPVKNEEIVVYAKIIANCGESNKTLSREVSLKMKILM